MAAIPEPTTEQLEAMVGRLNPRAIPFNGFHILQLLLQASSSVVELRTCVLRYCGWLLARRVLETLRTSGNIFLFYSGMAALHEPFQNMSV
jgi:hypothetical protein